MQALSARGCTEISSVFLLVICAIATYVQNSGKGISMDFQLQMGTCTVLAIAEN